VIVSTGSQANDFGTPGVRRYCRTVDSRSQARDLNREIRHRSYYQIALRALSIGESTCPEKGNQSDQCHSWVFDTIWMRAIAKVANPCQTTG
jgi:hypothetical protein